MALSEEQAVAYWNKHQDVRKLIAFVEAEVRKQDDALIRQMLEALETSGCYPPSSQQAITAARARLQS